MKIRIIILLIFFSLNLQAQTENTNQVRIAKNELGIGRNSEFEFKVLEPGVYSRNTFPIITIYKLKKQKLKQNCDVISKNGKGFDIILLVRYRFDKEAILNISKLSNPIPLQYLQYKLMPEVKFAARSIVANYSMKELNEKQVAKETLDFLRTRLKSGVIVNSLEIDINNK